MPQFVHHNIGVTLGLDGHSSVCRPCVVQHTVCIPIMIPCNVVYELGHGERKADYPYFDFEEAASDNSHQTGSQNERTDPGRHWIEQYGSYVQVSNRVHPWRDILLCSELNSKSKIADHNAPNKRDDGIRCKCRTVNLKSFANNNVCWVSDK